MKYNPFSYIRSEKDILKLVSAIIANTKGEGEKSSEDFWVKAEKLYFDKMLTDGVISTRGLGKDPFIVDELIFDVNTAYFESGGGYDYAVSFFEEAYRCAVEEIGGEECRCSRSC